MLRYGINAKLGRHASDHSILGLPLAHSAQPHCRALRRVHNQKHKYCYLILQGYTIQGATLDFSINATVTSPAAGNSNATSRDVVALGPSTPVGLSSKASQGICELLMPPALTVPSLPRSREPPVGPETQIAEG